MWISIEYSSRQHTAPVQLTSLRAMIYSKPKLLHFRPLWFLTILVQHVLTLNIDFFQLHFHEYKSFEIKCHFGAVPLASNSNAACHAVLRAISSV